MATTGSIDVNLTKISNIVNNSTETGAGITEGIADESDDMGEALGVTLTVLFYIFLVVVVLGIIFLILRWVKNVRSTASGMNK